MAFFFRNTKKDNFMTQEDKRDFEKNNICRFYEKTLNLI